MAAAGLGAPVVAPPHAGDSASHAHASDIDERATAAWLAALPCIAFVAAAAFLLGPPLGSLLKPARGAYTFTPDFALVVHPEPTEHARYFIALCLPLLIALATIAAPRWLRRPSGRPATWGAVAVQALFAAFVVACYVAQTKLRFGDVYTQEQGTIQLRYFKLPTLVVAAAGTGATLLVLRRARLREAAGALLRDSRARRAGALGLAVVATAIWMLHAIHSDASIANAPEDIRFHVSFPLDETFAVLNGLSPLVDFSAQYGSLWPYLVALPMLALGKTVLVFSLVMCVLTGLALLAIFGVLRRAVHSALAALLLYLPFLATSLFLVGGTFENRSSVGSYYGTFPLRYAAPYFLALLTARQIERDDRRGRSVWLLFLAGGLAILNNGDFGVAALGASVAALIWTTPDRSRAWARRIAAFAGAGLLTAFALVSLLTLVRAGSLPHLERLVDYAGLFTVAGFAMLPIPGLLGLHMVIFLTYVAAIVVATILALRREANRVLTGMLAWTGVFGLGSGGYYVGRSHPVALKSTFSVWALALALLTVVVVRRLAAHPPRRPTIAALAVLFGFGVCACSLAQMPTPWAQIDRLDARFVPNRESPSPLPLVPSTDPRTRAFVASLADGPGRFVVKRGAPVAIMLRTGHRIADAYGVRNVSPYTGIDSTPTIQRIEAVLDALEAAGGNTVILPGELDFGIFPVLERRGFRMLTPHGLRRFDPTRVRSGALFMRWPYGRIFKWVDTTHLYPRALR